MAGLTLTKQVEGSPEEVFAVFTDLEKAPERISGIVKLELLTDAPVGKGTRFRETRIMFKKEATEEMELCEFDPPRAYTVKCESCGCLYETAFRFTPEGPGTKVEMALNAKPITFFAKLMTPMAKLMLGSMRKAMDKDLEELKAAVESKG